MSQGLELPSVSNASQVSQASNRLELRENIDQSAPLVHNLPPAVSNIKPILKKILKICIIVILAAISIGLVTYLLSDSYLNSRVPEPISTSKIFSHKEVISPSEADYRSFVFFKKMQVLARQIEEQGRQVTPKQIKLFQEIKFKQLYDLYKVARTIQLAKQYSESQETKQFNYQEKQGLEIDEPTNFTEYFNDAISQYQCGSCYSFPISATVEFLYKYKYNITVKLSEQQLIDCVKDDPEANGCQDGNITQGFEYVRDIGLVTEDQYPYESIFGKSFSCKEKQISENATRHKISGFKMLPKGNCQSIKEELVKNNTVASMINAEGLGRYKMGQTFSDCKRVDLNHAITIVGQTEKNQWIIRNSWGKNWGKQGYFQMGRGNTCGICSHAIVPILVMRNNTVLTMAEIKAQADGLLG